MDGGIDPESMKAFLKEQPIGRLGRCEEAAAAMAWLCSPGAGTVLGVAVPGYGRFVAQ